MSVNSVGSRIRRHLSNNMQKALRAPYIKVVQESSAPKSGVHWGERGYNNPNRSSAPSEYPARQSGDLIAGLKTEVKETGGNIWGIFRSTAPHSIALEFGHESALPGSRVEPRPNIGGFNNEGGFMRRALFDTRQIIGKIIGRK